MFTTLVIPYPGVSDKLPAGQIAVAKVQTGCLLWPGEALLDYEAVAEGLGRGLELCKRMPLVSAPKTSSQVGSQEVGQLVETRRGRCSISLHSGHLEKRIDNG